MNLKTALAYTNPFAYIVGIPVVVGAFIGIISHRIVKDAKQIKGIVKEVFDE